MKKLFLLALSITFMITGCSSVSSRRQLDTIESIIEENTDSALWLLDDMSLAQRNEEDEALYQLLFTQARFILGKPICSDSLISNSILFFSQTDDKYHLALAYYYKGGILYETKQYEDAVLCLKKAEELSNSIKNEKLKNKIYKTIAEINYNSQDFDKALKYAKLFLQSSILVNDSALICRAYNDLALSYRFLNYNDSATIFQNKCMQFMEKDSIRIPSYCVSYAATLMNNKNYDEAEVWLCKAIELKPMPNQYVMLGRIAHSRGDTALARQYWEKALTFNDYATGYNAYNYLANLSSKRGNYQEAMRLKSKSDSLLYAYSNQNRVLQLAEIQQRYDKSVVEKNLAEEKVRWLCATVVGLVVIIILLVFVLYYKNKVKTYQDTISENVRQINDARLRISLLENSEKDYTEEINIQRRQLEQMQNAMNVKLGRGKETYEALKSGRGINVSTKEQEQDLVDYFAFTFYQEYTNFYKQYKSLSLRHLTYLILYHHMGMSDKNIAEVLSVTQSTVRNYRQRTKR